MNEKAGKMRKIISIMEKNKTIRLLHVKHARTFGERFKGLLGVSPREHDYALVFHMAEESALGASIHMLFMQMPIDVLWLNEKKEVVDFAALKPWTFNYTPAKPAKYVVELPARTLNWKIKIGMKLTWA